MKLLLLLCLCAAAFAFSERRAGRRTIGGFRPVPRWQYDDDNIAVDELPLHLRRRIVQKEDVFSSSEEEAEDGEIWAVIVAGSNGWYNYRHQADAAHAFHVLRAHGVAEDKIITMMFDDIANNKMNPFPGKLFNHPSFKNDVYAGVRIDYKGSSVNPSNFLNVLKGNASGIVGGNGRVVKSGASDRIFVFFTDHGATGLISFPDGILTTKELNDALLWMHKNQRYSELAFYLEACESGSMFENVLRDTIGVYAVTAANGHESSWGCYCENPKGLPCLGDLFSVSWMEDSDAEDLTKETVGEQFELVKKETNKSHVQHYGLLRVEGEPVADFQGKDSSPHRFGDSRMHWKQRLATAVESHDVELEHLRRQLQRTNDASTGRVLKERIVEILDGRALVRRVYMKVLAQLLDSERDEESVNAQRRKHFFKARGPISHPECHNEVVHTFHDYCLSLNEFPFAMKYVYVLNNLCNVEHGDATPIVDAMMRSC